MPGILEVKRFQHRHHFFDNFQDFPEHGDAPLVFVEIFMPLVIGVRDSVAEVRFVILSYNESSDAFKLTVGPRAATPSVLR